MADTALPTTNGASTMNPTSTRMGNSGDTWAGWAISSFTNKITTAQGEMQPTINGSTTVLQNELRATSLPGSRTATPAILLPPSSTSSDHTVQEPATTIASALANQESEDAFEAWAAMEDEDGSFFDAPSSRKRSPSPRIATKSDEDGEPDFAGWLAAQSNPKFKKPLPKGLTKPLSTRSNVADGTKFISTSGSGVGAKKPLDTASKPKVTVPVKNLDTKPKESELTEDGWGEDWD